MGAELGAEVDLEQAPLKYEGLSYTEIWISEAQERMVLAVPPEHWPELAGALRRARTSRRPSSAGSSTPAGSTLRYHGRDRRRPSMDFLHEGRPAVVRAATVHAAAAERPLELADRDDYTDDLLAILGTLGRRSKEWIVRQYDHEVQARTVVKPLVGVRRRRAGRRRGRPAGPRLDARPGDRLRDQPALRRARPLRDGRLRHRRGVRNCVAVGADPDRIALLDNFCWGNTERPETLGSLVLAAQGCHDLALAYGTPFISGKDSLNNEYTHEGQSLAIPPTLLISAIGQVPDVRTCVTMDLKEPGNVLLLVGHDPARAGRLALGAGPGPRGRPRAPGRPGRRAGPLPGGPRGDRAGPGPELPRPERGGPGRRPGRDGLRRAAWAPTSRSATSRATTTPRATPSCCSPNPRPGSSSKSAPSTSAPWPTSSAACPWAGSARWPGRRPAPALA